MNLACSECSQGMQLKVMVQIFSSPTNSIILEKLFSMSPFTNYKQ